jgi:syntaxin 1B/2/3
MQPLNDPFADPHGTSAASRDPNAILNDCRDVGRGIDDVEGQLQGLQRLHRQFVSGTNATNKEIDATGAEIMTAYRALADRVKRIKSKPEARNPRNEAQVNALDRRIRKAINNYQTIESQFRKDVQEQQRRQYLIVNPQATEQEILQATESGADTQIFQQALLNSDRRGQAQSTMANVRQRHDAIQQIERTMTELAQLFQDLDTIVMQQDPMIMNIEEKAEETQTNMVQANQHLDVATSKARSARRKKWYCLGICVAIVIVIILIIVIYLAATGKLGSHDNTKSA